MYSIYLMLIISVVSRVFGKDNHLEKVDYCSHPDCSLKNQHTLCIAAKRHSSKLFVSGMTSWMRYQILLLHNRHRDNIAMGLEAGQPPAKNMRKMYWDYELEEMADVWARQCQPKHDECRNTIRFNVLQNMDVRPVVPRMTQAQILADAVGAWFSGSRVLPTESIWTFNIRNCSAPEGCNANWYSAAAWASTWRIGCSQSLCTVNKRSCVLYRKRRLTKRNFLENQDFDHNTTTSNMPSSENLVRRLKYMTTQKTVPLDEFAKEWHSDDSELLLKRGTTASSIHSRVRKDQQIIAYTFCNYGPAGNINGFPMYEIGQTCANCPQGTVCGDSTHQGLCSVIGDPEGKAPK